MADAISLRHLRAQAVDAYKESGQIDLLTYPEGEPDAVTIRDSDMDGLRPGQYLSDNIIDFYIQYLQKKTRLSPTVRDRFYFFNSFFFRKLLESSSASVDSDECGVDFGQLRKWTQGVDLFEKDCIFIPVLHRSHWSLILICHLTSLKRCRESKPPPCIYHLDSFGRHERFDGKMRSYLLDAFMDGKDAINKDRFGELLALYSMKYIEAKVPQQDYEYDCGVYVLQYVEDILDAIIASNELRLQLNQLETYFAKWNTSKVCEKRMSIKRLILKLSGVQEISVYVKSYESQGTSKHSNDDLDKNGNACTHEIMKNEEVAQEDLELVAHQDVEIECGVHHNDGGKELDFLNNNLKEDKNIEHVELGRAHELDLKRSHSRIEDWHLTTTSSNALNNKDTEQVCGHVSPHTLVSREGNGWKWTPEATEVLLECMVKWDMFSKKTKRATDWKKISLEIINKNKERPSDKQCRLRYDTLLKAYKVVKAFCEKNLKTIGEITDMERKELRLSTTLHENWYNMIEKVCDNISYYQKPSKRLNSGPRIEESHPFGIGSRRTPMVPYNIVEGQKSLEPPAITKYLRPLEGNVHECEERGLQLGSKNKLVQPTCYSDVLTSEKEEKFIANLKDVCVGEIERFGPGVCAKVALPSMGSLSSLETFWTEEEFDEFYRFELQHRKGYRNGYEIQYGFRYEIRHGAW